jgi:predicted nucleic acid-binding protein
MIVVDSSGWLEVFTGGPRAADFRACLDEAEVILVPVIVLYEVYKIARREASEEQANTAAARLQAHRVVPLDDQLALEAADLSLEHGLAMADAVIYATARHYDALLVTSDADFAELPGVQYIESEGAEPGLTE